MNENQLRTYQKRVQKQKEKPAEERKEIKCNLFTLPTKERSFLSYNFLDCLFKTMKQQDYINLPSQVNQAVMKKLYQNWKSFFASIFQIDAMCIITVENWLGSWYYRQIQFSAMMTRTNPVICS
ncbi:MULTISPECIES: hypothetical protein [Bacillus]|nr:MULTISPECIES: hypothetical protein [Bacillus]